MGGLEVDRLGERLDVMLKPLEGLLAGVPGIAGTTLLGDGRVLIVLDLHEISVMPTARRRLTMRCAKLRPERRADSGHCGLMSRRRMVWTTADQAGSERG